MPRRNWRVESERRSSEVAPVSGVKPCTTTKSPPHPFLHQARPVPVSHPLPAPGFQEERNKRPGRSQQAKIFFFVRCAAAAARSPGFSRHCSARDDARDAERAQESTPPRSTPEKTSITSQRVALIERQTLQIAFCWEFCRASQLKETLFLRGCQPARHGPIRRESFALAIDDDQLVVGACVGSNAKFSDDRRWLLHLIPTVGDRERVLARVREWQLQGLSTSGFTTTATTRRVECEGVLTCLLRTETRLARLGNLILLGRWWVSCFAIEVPYTINVAIVGGWVVQWWGFPMATDDDGDDDDDDLPTRMRALTW